MIKGREEGRGDKGKGEGWEVRDGDWGLGMRGEGEGVDMKCLWTGDDSNTMGRFIALI